jgi:hypothetical protein
MNELLSTRAQCSLHSFVAVHIVFEYVVYFRKCTAFPDIAWAYIHRLSGLLHAVAASEAFGTR